MTLILMAQFVGAVEYADCISIEREDPNQRVTQSYLMARQIELLGS